MHANTKEYKSAVVFTATDFRIFIFWQKKYNLGF